ncbi:hypothetical protein [uncultured Amphritea sp.]|uniref:hypothetical protein n=1 Tax=uncultured Amphritea sp. TaxID=981605 RepID=UPI002609E032|nr:hypothetical protein [uncultured Amphritea sp.]
MEQLFKIAVKSSPIATIATGLMYFLFLEILGKEIGDNTLIVLAVLTFLFSIALLVFIGNKRKSYMPKVQGGISKVVVGDGDVFVGSKGGSVSEVKGKINDVKVNSGDVFVGNKESHLK